MKPTTIYLPEETEANLQKLATQTGKSIPEIIQELIANYLTKKTQKLPKSVGMGSSGRPDLSSKAEQLLNIRK
ncbi:MAG: CopG family transcriptional regulator [Okeania sp. SIO3B3]|nr:CopG family transcriptional regulator [Okeania sp. SIO3B3]